MNALIIALGVLHGPFETEALYLGNAGVLVTCGDTKVVFDPLFRELFDRYQPVPRALENALFAGEAPFEGLDGIFVSHHHADHFSPELMNRLLQARPNAHLFAPRQAVDALPATLRRERRIHTIELDFEAPPARLSLGELRIEALRVPHRGWPRYRSVENIVFRVTLCHDGTVVHLGDSDARLEHFPPEQWSSSVDMAFPPHWFFDTPDGHIILRDRLKARRAVGVHVPTRIPTARAKRPGRYRSVDLFTAPGEKRHVKSAR